MCSDFIKDQTGLDSLILETRVCKLEDWPFWQHGAASQDNGLLSIRQDWFL